MVKRKRYLQMGGYNYSYTPTESEAKTENAVNAGVAAVGAINPIIGLGLGAGQAIGKMTVDENGLYKSKSAEFFDNSFNPTTGVQDLVDVWKDPNASAIANKLSLGLVGNSNKERRREEALRAAQEASLQRNKQAQVTASNRILDGYNMYGTTGQSIYALGGKLNKLNSNTVEVDGNTHAEGGVQIPGAEVEDNETIVGDFVFSDKLGFADRHKTIAKQIAAVEKKPINKERRVTLEILRKKENALMKEQEGLKAQLFPDPMMADLTKGTAYTEPAGVPTMQMGGTLASDDALQRYLFQQEQATPLRLGSSALQNDVDTRLADSVPTKTGGGFNFGNVMKGLGTVLPYVTNIANLNRRSPRPTAPQLEAPIAANLVNYDATRNSLGNDLRGANNGLNAITNNGGVANAMRASNFANYLDTRSNLAQQEANTNTEIKNRTNIFNQQVGARNIDRQNDFQQLLLSRQMADQRVQQENLADFTNKIQLQQRDRRQMNLENRKLDSLLEMYKDTGVVDRNLLDEIRAGKYKFGGKVKTGWKAY